MLKSKNSFNVLIIRIQKFSLLKRDFSLVTGELTPTLKMKRGFISSLYSEEINKMYS